MALALSAPSNLTMLLYLTPAFIALYVVSLVIYRLFFHPFAKYSGPFWAKFSYFYAFYHAWIGDTGQTQLRCHQRYGPVVRYTPDNLLFSNPQAIKDIHGAGKNFSKGKAYAPMNAQPGTWNLAFTPHKKEHARRRRIINQGFSERSVKDAQPFIKSHVTKLCDHISINYSVTADKWSSPVNVENPWFWTSLDTTTDLVFGSSFETLSSTNYRAFGHILQNSLRRFSLIAQYPHIFRPGVGRWADFGTWFLPDISHQLLEIVSVGAASAMQRIQSPPKEADQRKDVLSYLINSTDPETGTAFEDQEIVTEAIILLLAGGDTVAGALQTLFFYLVRNNDAYGKLVSEIRGMFESADDVSLGVKMEGCIYLNACIDEGLRLLNGTAFWRDADEGGAMVCDEYIPQGLTAGIAHYVVTRDEEYFPEAFKFHPERWISGEKYSDEQIKTARTVSQPFSLGPRGCVAKRLALGMMKLVVARVLWEFDVRKAEGSEGRTGEGRRGRGKGLEREEEYQLLGSFTVHGEGPVLQFRKRPEV